MGVRRGIDRKKVGCRSLIDANLEGQVGVNKFEQYLEINTKTLHLSHSVRSISTFHWPVSAYYQTLSMQPQ